MEILINGDVPKVIEYMKDVKEKTKTKEPKDICINVSVTSLNYEWMENFKKYRHYNGSKYLTAPKNSQASIVHNELIKEHNLNIKDIEAGDKIGFLYMKIPNILPNNSDALAFKNDKIFEYKKELKEYIDYDTMYEKGFYQGIRLITDPLGWDLTPDEDKISDDDW